MCVLTGVTHIEMVISSSDGSSLRRLAIVTNRRPIDRFSPLCVEAGLNQSIAMLTCIMSRFRYMSSPSGPSTAHADPSLCSRSIFLDNKLSSSRSASKAIIGRSDKEQLVRENHVVQSLT